MTETTEAQYKLRIVQDPRASDPREECDNLGTMVCFAKGYNLGDNNDIESGDFNGWDEMEEHLIKECEAQVILPLYMYSHSGITINTTGFTCRWDSGRIGFIYCSLKAAKEWFGSDEDLVERAKKHLVGEIETYDQWLTGDVHGYEIVRVTTCDHGHDHEEVVDSCWGFYGEDYCRVEGEASLKHYKEVQDG